MWSQRATEPICSALAPLASTVGALGATGVHGGESSRGFGQDPPWSEWPTASAGAQP